MEIMILPTSLKKLHSCHSVPAMSINVVCRLGFFNFIVQPSGLLLQAVILSLYHWPLGLLAGHLRGVADVIVLTSSLVPALL